MSADKCQCGAAKKGWQLLCTRCWGLVDPDLQREVMAGFRRAKARVKRDGIRLVRALVDDKHYMAAQRAARAQAWERTDG